MVYQSAAQCPLNIAGSAQYNKYIGIFWALAKCKATICPLAWIEGSRRVFCHLG